MPVSEHSFNGLKHSLCNRSHNNVVSIAMPSRFHMAISMFYSHTCTAHITGTNGNMQIDFCTYRVQFSQPDCDANRRCPFANLKLNLISKNEKKTYEYPIGLISFFYIVDAFP